MTRVGLEIRRPGSRPGSDDVGTGVMSGVASGVVSGAASSPVLGSSFSVAIAGMLTWALALTLSSAAFAQHDSGAGSAPPPPPGPGQIVVQITSADASESVAGLSIALYALASDGTPGLANGETDSSGRAEFANVSNDPNIVYLIGARYAEIPFGERVAFAPGATEARVEIQVSSPTTTVSGVRVDEIRARIDWMGDRVVVTEILRITSSGNRVIKLPVGDATAAIVERPLPAAATDFSAGPNSLGDGLTLDDGTVRFAGPLYPGDQRVEYRYSLPIDASSRHARIPIELREAAGRVVVVAGTTGLEIQGPDFVASRELTSDSGEVLPSWARGPLSAGRRIEVEMTLPESRRDPSLLSIARGDVWIDLDDTRVNANVDLKLSVEPGAPIAGSPDAPLMRVRIPSGATLEGVAPEAEAMGLIPTANGGFDVIGPIASGEHSFAFSYRLPSDPEGVELDMQFPREVATLNVLIADSGLALDSSRLHRRRPFRSGTRNFLHREAFNISPDEVVDLSLEPLRATGLPQQASLAISIAAIAAAALFLVAPLRSAERSEATEDPALLAIRNAREAVYVAIGDLDHDLETGKLDTSDHAEMRAGLLARAIELLRSERAETDGAAETSPTLMAIAGMPESDIATGAIPATGKFCPSCGGGVHAQWQFCSHCGDGLNPSGASSTHETSGKSAG